MAEFDEGAICNVCGSVHAPDRVFGSEMLLQIIDDHQSSFVGVAQDFSPDVRKRYLHNALRARNHLNNLIESIEESLDVIATVHVQPLAELRCPVCGQPPASVDRVDIGNGPHVETVPAAYHCANENDDQHLRHYRIVRS